MKKHGTAFKYSVAGLLFLLLMASLLVITASADNPSGFHPKAILPPNQVDKQQTYFDLRLLPGESQTVQMSITNAEDRAILADVSLNPAATAQNGVVVYSIPDARDESALYSITDVAQVITPQVEVPANSSVLVDIQIDMPDKSLDGMLLGGLTVTASYLRETDTQEPVQEEGNFQIENKFAYVIGLKLTQNDNLAQGELHLKSITPGLINYRNAVMVNLQNSEPVLMKRMQVEAEIYKEGAAQPLKQLSLPNAEMAPNSNADFAIEWDGGRIEPGNYRLKMRAEHLDRVWEWDEAFVIESGLADAVNEEAVNVVSSTPIWLYILLALILLLLLALAAYWLGRRSKRRET